jgi:hypothetical protein
MQAQVTPGLRCDGNALAELVRLYTNDHALADRIRAANVTPWTLCQALPLLLDDDDAALLHEHKATMCRAAGLTQQPHCVPAAPADAAAPPPEVPRLRPARFLRGKRLRVSLAAATPHFCRTADGRVACNRCERGIAVHNDAQLAALVYASAWHELHWKAFLCEACTDCVRHMPTQQQLCHVCFGAREAPVRCVPLRYARADDATQPRMLPLCSTCAAKPPVRAQLATVRILCD